MSELTGGRTNYYLVPVLHPQREDQPPYQAECEDIADALQLTPNEFCEFKAIWRTAAARLGNGKPNQKALYDAEKRVHYAQRDLLKLQRALCKAEPVKVAGLSDEARDLLLGQPDEMIADQIVDGQALGDGWFAHRSGKMPEHFNGDELIEVTLEDEIAGVPLQYTGNFAKPAKDWIWAQDGTSTSITAWRLLALKPVEPQGPDDWKVHDSLYLPAGLDADELVEIKFSNGHEAVMAKRADRWDWTYRQQADHEAPHISHWRRYRHQAF